MSHYAVLTMFYADDLGVVAPSPCGLQALFNICSRFGFENDVICNPIKSKSGMG